MHDIIFLVWGMTKLVVWVVKAQLVQRDQSTLWGRLVHTLLSNLRNFIVLLWNFFDLTQKYSVSKKA